MRLRLTELYRQELNHTVCSPLESKMAADMKRFLKNRYEKKKKIHAV